MITSELAQQIVDHILPILQQNINLMDINGTIIASGQKHRIGDFHKGAKDAIDNGCEIAIHIDDLDRFPGAMPGFNLPITIGGQIIGVVGISGEPAEVRQSARLVKMVTELILDREVLAEDLRSLSRQKEQFASLLLSDQAPAMFPQLSRQANRLECNLMLARMVAVIDVKSILNESLNTYGSYDLVSIRAQDRILQYIGTSPLVDKQDLTVFLDKNLIILKHFPLRTQLGDIGNWSASFIQHLSDGYPGHLTKLGFGSLADSPLKLHISYEEATFALARSSPQENIRSIFEPHIMVPYVLKNPEASGTCAPFLDLKAKIAGDLDHRYDIRKTLMHFLEHNQNFSHTAQSLFIHRNTLIFRLEKLKESSGLCPGQYFEHAVICKLLLEI
jgi:carbohydrate diacid regulator